MSTGSKDPEDFKYGLKKAMDGPKKAVRPFKKRLKRECRNVRSQFKGFEIETLKIQKLKGFELKH